MGAKYFGAAEVASAASHIWHVAADPGFLMWSTLLPFEPDESYVRKMYGTFFSSLQLEAMTPLPEN